MNAEERDRILLALAEDLENSLLCDRRFRFQFCVEHFRNLSDDELLSDYNDAFGGLENEEDE